MSRMDTKQRKDGALGQCSSAVFFLIDSSVGVFFFIGLIPFHLSQRANWKVESGVFFFVSSDGVNCPKSIRIPQTQNRICGVRMRSTRWGSCLPSSILTLCPNLNVDICSTVNNCSHVVLFIPREHYSNRLMVSWVNLFSQSQTFLALFDLLVLRHLVSSNRSQVRLPFAGLTEKVTRRIGTWPLPLGTRLDRLLIEHIVPQHQTGFIEFGICMNLSPTRNCL